MIAGVSVLVMLVGFVAMELAAHDESALFRVGKGAVLVGVVGAVIAFVVQV